MHTAHRNEELELVRQAQQGDQTAFRLLVERYQQYVYTLALRMLASPQDAEDAAQEVFLSAWWGLPDFRMEAKFSTWLYRLTINASTDLLRKRSKTEGQVSMEEAPVAAVVADPAPTPEEEAQRKEGQAALQQAILELTEDHRTILLLREVEGLDYREIGEALHLSPGTVRSRLARARLELCKKLRQKGNYFEPDASKKGKGDEGHAGM